jgi:hypothetical protein
VLRAASNKLEKVQILIKQGANLNQMNGAWSTPVMQAVSWAGQFDVALALLEAGADYRIYKPRSNTKLVHIVASVENQKQRWTPKQAADYEKLVDWLEKHGESIANAKADTKPWQSWNKPLTFIGAKWTLKSQHAKRGRRKNLSAIANSDTNSRLILTQFGVRKDNLRSTRRN